jgi:hypothetical protein
MKTKSNGIHNVQIFFSISGVASQVGEPNRNLPYLPKFLFSLLITSGAVNLLYSSDHCKRWFASLSIS